MLGRKDKKIPIDIWFIKNVQINCKHYRNPYQIKIKEELRGW